MRVEIMKIVNEIDELQEKQEGHRRLLAQMKTESYKEAERVEIEWIDKVIERKFKILETLRNL
jgi:hypothetical protein